MRPESVTANGYGQKALAIFVMAAAHTSESRQSLWDAMCNKFSPKSVQRKCDELAQRGYITPSTPWTQATLTDKGRQALEMIQMSSG